MFILALFIVCLPNLLSSSKVHIAIFTHTDCPLSVSLSPTGWPLDRGLLYSIETLIVQWSGQIWNVLKKDSGMVLLRGDHPGPNVELQFWTTQRENLLGIQSQV